MPVEIEGPTPAPGTIVTADEREVGEVRSSRDGVGLAVLRIEAVVAGKLLRAGSAAISAIPALPSLQTVCICKSPRNRFDHSGFAARIMRASARVRKSRRIGGGLISSRGGFSIQAWSSFEMKGPTP